MKSPFLLPLLLYFLLTSFHSPYLKPVPPNEVYDFELDYLSEKEGPDQAKVIIETRSGEIGFAGFATTADRKKQAFLSVLPNPTTATAPTAMGGNSTPLIHQYYGGRGDDEILGMHQTPDGSFLLVGYSEGQFNDDGSGPGSGAKDAWIIKTDAAGNIIKDTLLGGNRDDILHRIYAIGGGNYVAVGEKAGKMWVVKFDENLRTVVDRQFRFGRATAVARRATSLGILGGHDDSVMLFEVDDSLNLQRSIHSSGYWRVRQAIFDPADLLYEATADRYLVAAAYRGVESVGLKILSIAPSNAPRTKDQVVYSYDERADELPVALLRDPRGGFWLAGKTKSIPDGTSVFNPLLLRLTADWKEQVVLEEAYLRQTIGGEVAHLSWGRDEDLLLAGSKRMRQRRSDDAWVAKLSRQLVSPTMSPPLELEFAALRLEHSDRDSILMPGVESLVVVKVKNVSDHPAKGLFAQLDVAPELPGLLHLRRQQLPVLKKGQSYRMEIPIRGGENLVSSSTQIRVRVHDPQSGMAFLSPESLLLQTQAGPFPILRFQGLTPVLTDSNPPYREEVITQTVYIKNYGGATARSVGVRINFPYLVDPVGAQLIQIDSVASGERLAVSFQFKAGVFYPYDKIRVSCVLYEEASSDYDYFSFDQGLNPLPVFESPGGEFISHPSPSWLRYPGGQGRLSPLWYDPLASGVEWAYDAATLDSLTEGKFELFDNYIVLKAQVRSPEALNTSDFSFYHHLKGAGDFRINDGCFDTLYRHGPYEYHYLAKVKLLNGWNELRLLVDKIGAQSTTIRIKFTPPKLHYIGLGVPYQDLRNTTKDVRDLCKPFVAQVKAGGPWQLYSRVDTHLLVREGQTTNQALQSFFEELAKHRTIAGQPVHNHDHLTFVGSFHGRTNQTLSDYSNQDSTFYLLASEYPTTLRWQEVAQLERNQRLDFNRVILQSLVGLNCNRTFLMIDACFSARVAWASRKYSDQRKPFFDQLALGRTINAAIPQKVYVLASAVNLSWEGNGNGYLVGAILDAFSGEAYTVRERAGKRQIKRQNVKGENRRSLPNQTWISMRELYRFCYERVDLCSYSQQIVTVAPPQLEEFPLFMVKKTAQRPEDCECEGKGK